MFVMETSLVVIQRLVPVEKKIRRFHSSLANQIEIAAGSAGELTVGLRIALAKGYVTAADLAEVDGPLDQVRAMLYRLTHR